MKNIHIEQRYNEDNVVHATVLNSDISNIP